MTFWRSFDVAGGVGLQLLPLAFGEILLALLIGAARPGARARLRAATLLVVASILVSVAETLVIILFPDLLSSTPIAVVGWTAEVMFLVGTILIWAVFLFRVLLPPLGLAPVPILRDALLGLIFAAATIALLGKHGVDLSGIAVTSAVLTGVIGFGLQDVLGSLVGGISLQLEGTIAVGDYIRVDKVEGQVTEASVRQISVETFYGDTIVIPNNVITKSIVTIYGRTSSGGTTHRLNLFFELSASVAPETVIDIVEKAFAGQSIANVAASPPPFCTLNEFRESSCFYMLSYFVEDPFENPRRSEMQERIHSALLQQDIRIATPTLNVNASRRPKLSA